MRSASPLTWLLLGLAIVASDVAAQTPAEPIRWPNERNRTLQAEIDSAPDGAILEIRAGTFDIAQPIHVRGKRLAIHGAGGDRAGRVTHLKGRDPRPVVDAAGRVVLAAEDAEGLFNAVGADITLQDLKLTGFDAALVAQPDSPAGARETARATNLNRVAIARTGRGIVNLAAGPTLITDSSVKNTLWHALSVQGQGLDVSLVPSLSASGLVAVDAGCAGVLVVNGLGIVTNSKITGATCGGIVGLKSNLIVIDSTLSFNFGAGILVSEGFSSQIVQNLIAHTAALPATGFLGDGVVVALSGAQVLGNIITDTARAGVAAFGGEADLIGNTVTCSAFPLNVEPLQGQNGALIDSGGNKCGCNGPPGPCLAASANLAPPVAEIPP